MQALGLDKNSLAGDIVFVNAEAGDYMIQNGSKVFETGFENFDMNFGVVSERLKSKAKKIAIPKIRVATLLR